MILNGTTYDDRTPKWVARLLEGLRASQARITVVLGEPKTGKPWGDRPRSGRLGRSMGPIKIPLLLHNRRSMGDWGLFTDAILEIRYSNKKVGGTLYRHPKYKPSTN